MDRPPPRSTRHARARAFLLEVFNIAAETGERTLRYTCDSYQAAVALRFLCYEYRRAWRGQMAEEAQDMTEYTQTLLGSCINDICFSIEGKDLVMYFRTLPGDPPIREQIMSRLKIGRSQQDEERLPPGLTVTDEDLPMSSDPIADAFQAALKGLAPSGPLTSSTEEPTNE